ncbi:hypothetical protein FM996_11715 [Methylosinus sporium]|jgi:hypothetical protein|uniref:Stability/partitioning determinant n=1 Tax=Methylosinus sporium TaxID=428 RepID=A0A549ST49_METSR|nr:hypothetical protein [Methylosinus sp. C49]TRL32796.1 hypothetical protein FM996_11715 [Methylosinus sporium]BBU64367.1 hypothetical protein MSC49_43020 [Methylosinus sp. C49]
MADLSKLMKKRLGAPPTLDDTADVLKAPEVAPLAPTSSAVPRRGEDGRSARRTGRTLQFATRVSEEFDARFRKVAKRDGLLLAQLLEKALDAYENR